MPRARVCSNAVWCVLAGVVAGGGFAPRAGADVPIRVAAAAGLSGYAAPGVPGASLSVIGAPQLADDGSVLATCRIVGPGVIYASNDLVLASFDRFGHGTLLSRTGIQNTTGVDGATFSATFFPRLGKDGSVAAVGFLAGAGIDSNNSTGYWRGNQNAIELALRSGDAQVPGVPGAAFYGFVASFPCVISQAGVAFGAQLAVGTGNVTINDYQGLWGPGLAGELELLARPGILAGAGSPPQPLASIPYLRTNPKSLVLADNGMLAFQATLVTAAPDVTDADDTLIVRRGANGVMTIAAREGMSVPGYAGVVLKSLDTSAFVPTGGLSMNGAGWIAFGDIDGADQPASGVSHLWRLSSGGRWDLLAARDISTAAGRQISPTGTFATILAPAMNSAGATVFAATATSSDGTPISGLWLADASGTINLLAASGLVGTVYSPPGVSGGAFAADPPARGSYRINARGQVVFRWKLQAGVGGVTSTNDDGLWAWDPAVGLLKIARTGDAVPVNGTSLSIRSINTFLGPGGDDDGRITDLNRLGEVAFVSQFTDNTGALLVAQLPGTGACCRGAICTLASSAACTGDWTRFAGIGTACPPGPTAACCPADFDQSGVLDSSDIFSFINAWLAGSLSADTDRSGSLEALDILAFVNTWYHGC